MKLNNRLLDMLAYKRPHGSQMEIDWATKFIMPYNPKLYGDEDTMAYVVTVGKDSHVLFSAHTDTVHRKEGKQKLHYVSKTNCIVKRDKEPLGADDGAGCWLLLEMIDAGVPGTYVFHRGEEQGGIGSKWMAKNKAVWLEQFDYAIAFDRKATHSIITHQGYGMCCSKVFGEALAGALNDQNLNFMYVTDDTGIYTDTAEYTEIIPECTNVSVGYYAEHTPDERLDVAHLYALRDACIHIEWDKLPVKRRPGEDDFQYTGGWNTKGKDKDNLAEMSLADMRDMAYMNPEDFALMVYNEINGGVLDDSDEHDYLSTEWRTM